MLATLAGHDLPTARDPKKKVLTGRSRNFDGVRPDGPLSRRCRESGRRISNNNRAFPPEFALVIARYQASRSKRFARFRFPHEPSRISANFFIGLLFRVTKFRLTEQRIFDSMSRRIPLDQGFQNGLQNNAPLSRTCFSRFKIDPALVESVEHPNARERIIHTL